MLSGKHKNGVYQILNRTKNILYVYCDFSSEPGAAWTLVQSYSLEKGQSDRGLCRGRRVSWKQLVELPSVPSQYGINSLSLHSVASDLWISNNWHWLQGLLLRVTFQLWPLHPSTNSPLSCKLYEFINIRGNQYIKCTAATVEMCVRVARGVAEINSSFLSFITFSTRWKFFFSRRICLLTSWANTIGIWSMLTRLNLITQIY